MNSFQSKKDLAEQAIQIYGLNVWSREKYFKKNKPYRMHCNFSRRIEFISNKIIEHSA